MLYETNGCEPLDCRLNLDLSCKNLARQGTLSYLGTLHALTLVDGIVYCDKDMHATVAGRTSGLAD